MNPRRDNHCLLLLRFLDVFDIALLGYRQDLAVLAWYRFAKRLPLAEVFSCGIHLDVVEVLQEIGIGVWNAVSKVDCVVVVRELVTEREGVVGAAEAADVSLDVVAEVGYLVAASVPATSVGAILVGTFRHLFRVDAYFHSKVEEGVGFGKVLDVELDVSSFSSVFNLEEEPLSVTISVDVILHQQIIFCVWFFLSQV